jgi:hypothetical protein
VFRELGRRVKLKESITLTGLQMAAMGQFSGFQCYVLSAVLGVKNSLVSEKQSI